MTTYKQRLLDLFITAYEGGSSYWARLSIIFSEETQQKFNAGLSPSEHIFNRMFNDNKEFRVWDAENGDLLGTISKANLKEGYRLLKAEHESHYADILNENWDATTADIFMQLSVMQEIVFG